MSTSEARIVAPFILTVDSREQNPYTFEKIYGNKDQKNALLHVPTMRIGLPDGDYSLLGLPSCVVERKSREDIYASVARRDNFVGRLERMSDLKFAAVLVEADRLDLICNPPKFTKYNPKALSRTLWAWQVRYPVRWVFMPGREAAEMACYRMLAACWEEYREEAVVGVAADMKGGG